MQQYRIWRAARSELKAAKQMENESLKDYLGPLFGRFSAFRKITHKLRDQFLKGLLDLRLKQKLDEDETDRNFCEILYRAQELYLIQKKPEQRRGPVL